MGEDASEERRLFEPRDGGALAYVTGDLGILRVDLGPDRIGEFSLVERCQAKAVAVDDSLAAVGTDETVLIDTGDGFTSTDFGPAMAVGVEDGTVFAAGPDGTVARREGADDWQPVGTVSDPRQFDGRSLAASDGVYRVGAELERSYDGGARDVTGEGSRVATDDGLVRHESGAWHREYDEAASVVAGSYALDAEGLLERTGDRWDRRATPAGTDPVALVDGTCLYAVTDDGQFLVSVPGERATDGQGGWRSRTLGVRGVTGLGVRE
jgi:hypothetical protein